MSSVGTGLSVADILHLVYEGSSGAGFGANLDQTLADSQQRQQLLAALQRQGETLSDDEKRAVANGSADEVKKLLERIRQRRAEENRRTRDGITHSRIPQPTSSTSEILPAADLGMTGLLEWLDTQVEARPWLAKLDFESVAEKTPESLLSAMLVAGEHLSEHELAVFRSGDLSAIKEILKSRFARSTQKDGRAADSATPERSARAAKYDAVRLRPPTTDEKALSEGRAALLKLALGPQQEKSVERALAKKEHGQALTNFDYRSGLPSVGRSGSAHRVPLLQFIPARLRTALSTLGVTNLADFLATASLPECRVILSRLLGLPTTAVLLAAHRAELLDLPVCGQRGKAPHLKDVLLLTRLGVITVGRLAALGAALELHPERLELLATALAALQKSAPDLIGRNRTTRHDLKEWCRAAARRGSNVSLAAKQSADASPIEHAAERILAWHLNQGGAQPDDVWEEMVVRLLIMMRQRQLALDSALWATVDASRRKIYRQVIERSLDEHDLDELAHERALAEAFLVNDEGTSIMTALDPVMVPDVDRTDDHVCFWVDPVADERHIVGASRDGLPPKLQAHYVCMNTRTGEIVPFGVA